MLKNEIIDVYKRQGCRGRANRPSPAGAGSGRSAAARPPPPARWCCPPSARRRSREEERFYRHYVDVWRDRCLLVQMGHAAGFATRGPEELPALREVVRARFGPELAFLEAMPEILLTPDVYKRQHLHRLHRQEL